MFQRLDSNDDPEQTKKMRSMMAPHVDQMIRQAIGSCWMVLPEDRQNVDEVEKEIRRLVDRALRDFREDVTSFGIPQ